MLRGPRARLIGALSATALAAAVLASNSHAQGLPSVRGTVGGITSGVGGAIGGVGGAIGNTTGGVGGAIGGAALPGGAPGRGAGSLVGSTGRVIIRSIEGAGNGNNPYGAAGNTGGIAKATGVTRRNGRIFLTGPGGAASATAAAPRSAARQRARRVMPPEVTGTVRTARSRAGARPIVPVLASVSAALPLDQAVAPVTAIAGELVAPFKLDGAVLPLPVGNLLLPDIAFTDDAGWLAATAAATGDPAWAQLRRAALQAAAPFAAQGFTPSTEAIAFVESAECWRQINFSRSPLDRLNPESLCPPAPANYRVASLGAPSEARDLIKSDSLSVTLIPFTTRSQPVPPVHFPTVDRGAKGSRVVMAPTGPSLSPGPRVELAPAPGTLAPRQPGDDRLALRIQPALPDRSATRDTVETPRDNLSEGTRENLGPPDVGEPQARPGGEARDARSALRLPPIVPGLRGRETPQLRPELPPGADREAAAGPDVADEDNGARRSAPGRAGEARSALRIAPQPGDGARITAPPLDREQSPSGSRSNILGPATGEGTQTPRGRGGETRPGERIRPSGSDNFVLRETQPGLGGEQPLEQPRTRQGAPATADILIAPRRRAPRSDDAQLALRGDTAEEAPRITQPDVTGEIPPREARSDSARPDAAAPPAPLAGAPQRSDVPTTRADAYPRIAALPQVTPPDAPIEKPVEEPRSDTLGPAFAAVTPRLDFPKLKQGEPMVAPPPLIDLLDPGALRTTPAALEPWRFDQEPLLLSSQPRVPADPELKSSIFNPPPSSGEEGLTIVSKGEVTGKDQRPKTPAEMLGLSDETRPVAQKCMAEAVYFEARGEPISGQIAVAQVVLNRALSGHYPRDICGVVYQNSERFLACQFTFACDGIPDAVRDAEAYGRAERIARDMLDGRLWIEDVGKATHYHANWVAPWWRRVMNTIIEIGVHIFYRPFNWGDGSDAPGWGNGTRGAPQSLTPY